MSLPLTAKYRPQRFSDVAGQEILRSILSRACAEDKIAPAYLFSGTRGVGKTTLARIMAKAINCVTAPTAEPCNKCTHCVQITQGAAVDVVEIDGASNRGIDDARRIKEDIGYAPMDCRYKVFIIDEAHMLTKEAFNALLKTLEEPPRNATFIMATTEPHKFPATIVSRCQHYTFKRLSLKGLEDHLARILKAEAMDFDPAAVRLLARRAAGSVRDSMSLLGQVLALGRERLAVEDVRGILGLAGHEIYARIMETVRDQDPIGLASVLRDVLDQGLDLGFFLRELTMVWRNLFLLKQVGESAFPMLDLAEDEARQWLGWAEAFTATHIHACWQLTLEGQRRVLTSVDPALALELLLLNMAYLPQLVSLEQLACQAPSMATEASAPRAAPQRPAPAKAPATSGYAPRPDMRPDMQPAPEALPAPHPARPVQAQEPAAPVAQAPVPEQPVERPVERGADAAGFQRFCLDAAKRQGRSPQVLRQCQWNFAQGRLTLHCMNSFHYNQVADAEFQRWLRGLAEEYFGPGFEIVVTQPKEAPVRHDQLLRADVESHPVVKRLTDDLGARIIPGSVKDTP